MLRLRSLCHPNEKALPLSIAARGGDAVAVGGEGNAASGQDASVSGGRARTAAGDDSWAAGSLLEPN